MPSLYVLVIFALIFMRRRRAGRRLNVVRELRRIRRQRFRQQQVLGRIIFALILANTAIGELDTTERRFWTRYRSNHWWEHVVNEEFDEEEWMQNFRMSRATFTMLCDKLRPYSSKKDTRLRKCIAMERRIALCIWRLATNSSYREIGHLFGVSTASACIITNSICSTLVKYIMPRYVRLPQGDRVMQTVNGFEDRWGFPQCFGAIDGTHIPIIAPQQYHSDYFNRKGWHSVVMQGIVDHSYRFTDVLIGWPGRVHDARIFANSSIYRSGNSGSLFPVSEFARDINGVKVPLLLLGDPAYPLLEWLMKPFQENGHLSREQRAFNYRLSRARMVVENAFGRLKGRWRCLLKRNDASIVNVPTIVGACVTLHNLCEIQSDAFDNDWFCSDSEQPAISQGSSQSVVAMRHQASGIRNALVSYFSQNEQ